MSKYNNRRVTVEGHAFDSLAEARRYQELCLLHVAGEITGLVIHPRFPLVVNGVPIATYEADFGYTETATGRAVVEDVKGVRTDVYRIKCKLMRACYGIEVKEVAA